MKMPVLDVCHNRAAHQDKTVLFHFNNRQFFVVCITIPFSQDEDDTNGVQFNRPRPLLVRELLRHDPAECVLIRHTLCEECRVAVDADINELMGE